MKIGISPSLAAHFPHLQKADCEASFDVTLVLTRENQDWLHGRWRRLRPHFVETVADARRIVELYSEDLCVT